MRGDVNGNQEPEVLFPLASEGGLALASKSEAGHLDWMIAARKRQQAQLEANRKLTIARAQAAVKVQQAHEQRDADHAQAKQKVASARQQASNRRKAAHNTLKAAPERAKQIKADAKLQAKEKKAEAKRKAAEIKQKANNKRERMIREANEDLAAARRKKDKYD